MDCGIVLAYFSPCDFKLLRQHAIDSLKIAIASGVPVSFAEVIQPGQVPIEVPPGLYSHIVFESADFMFYKENLWNLAAEKLPTENLIFLDADVYFKNEDWLTQILMALTQFDVIQPFKRAHWLDKDGNIITSRNSCFYDLVSNPAHGISWPVGHPGFGFAMKHETHKKLGGFYELCVAGGGGDIAFAYTMSDTFVDRVTMRHREKDASLCFFSPAYTHYRNRALSLNWNAGFANLNIFHRWHGDKKFRDYAGRFRYFNCLPDYMPVERRSDGLLQWTISQPEAKNYFQSRMEDGVV